ncbi:MAG TPA: 4-alpha-glucanotransferase [Mycobacteriales bacterium]|nr:4-alpha-glucanotransferase [Mycobacteriales bacterium]
MDDRLGRLADAHGVATSYTDAQGEQHVVDRSVVVAVLGHLGVDASSAAAIETALARGNSRTTTLVLTPGQQHAIAEPGLLTTENGVERPVSDSLPADLPIGYHRLRRASSEQSATGEQTVIVAPARLSEPASAWGWMLQLYALRSEKSWGIGDLGDLGDFADWARQLGAGAILVNPLNAITPTLPVRRSPYSPSSRSFANPLYLSITRTAEFAAADEQTRARVIALQPDGDGELLDYDAVWTAKEQALRLLRPYAHANEPADRQLRDFATFCALAEKHGPDWRHWPAQLRDPGGAAVARARIELADAIDFHSWVQHLCATQLAATRRDGIAIIHDLPVGVDAGGADAWALQDMLATGVRVGAPPDPFNQQGQDWDLPPWRPDRLAAAGYTPLRDMLARELRTADGLRVDHVAGLWRLWWIPPGQPPHRGTYVSYDAAALLAVLTVEAHRAGAMVIGEDLGTVRAEVTEALHARDMASSVVLWFARDGQRHRPPRDWPRAAMASVSTHDLPTAAGFLSGEQVRVRAELGVLARPVAEEERAAEADRRALLDLIAEEGLAGPDATEAELLVALHALLARAPSRLLLASLTDVLADRRQPNMPGTIDEYPNWRLKLSRTLEQLGTDEGLLRCIAPLRAARPG